MALPWSTDTGLAHWLAHFRGPLVQMVDALEPLAPEDISATEARLSEDIKASEARQRKDISALSDKLDRVLENLLAAKS